jgi:restriction endonuclease S subunit
MSFTLGKSIDASKVFIERKANVTVRWDPFYYRPELVALEKQVAGVTTKRLRDFALSTAGGATPSTTQAEEHYDTTPENGVPFIRVQNLSTTGELNLEDVKHITRSTHQGLLKRSRLQGGELLIKITGVGRMAVSSVVPYGFEGNINQHIVAIRTDDIETSKTLAAFLNLDLAEKLASRRATGGTRPALDYPALLSIPIIFDNRIPQLLGKAFELQKERLCQAKALLASIDDLLLAELGIPNPPEQSNTLECRMFQRRFSEVSGKRIDPASNWKRLIFSTSKYPTQSLRKVAEINPMTIFPNVAPDTPISFVPMEGVSDVFGEITERQTRAIGESRSYTTFKEGDVIWAKITPCMENGKSAVARYLELGYGFGSTEFHVFRPNPEYMSSEYLHHLLRLKTVRKHARLNFTGSSGHQRVDQEFFLRMEIPIPPINVQRSIAEKAESAKTEAKNLFAQAQADLEQAKRDIEAMILGEPTTISADRTTLEAIPQ